MVVTTSDKPDFAAMTAGRAMFAVVGAIAMINAGNEIIRKYGVEDPAVFIGQEVSKYLAEAWSIDVVQPVSSGKEDALDHLVAEHSGSDYVLDVRTISWSFGYFPTDWDNYRVMYSVKSRLIDVQAKEVVAEAFCFRVPKESYNAPSHNELLNDDAARLKAELKIAAEHCVDELREKLL